MAASLTLPASGQTPGLTYSGSDLSGNPQSTSFMNFDAGQAYADSGGGLPNVDVNGAVNSGGLTVNSTPQTQSPAPSGGTSGGNGGGGTSGADPHINPATGVWDDNYYATHAGAANNGVQSISQADLDAAYAPIYNTIQGMTDQTTANQSAYLKSQTDQYDALQPGIDLALTTGQNLNQQQMGQNQSVTQNALAAARELYNELQTGAHQMFGGASGAADFAKAFYAKQLGTNEGQAYSTEGQNQNSLQTQMANIQATHDQNTQALALQKQQALDQANQAFQQQLLSIQGLKAQTDQAKASAKLDALTQLNNTVNTINQSWTQLQQSMDSQNQAGLIQLRNQTAYAQAFAGQPLSLAAQQGLQASQIGGPTTNQSAGAITGNAGNTGVASTVNPYLYSQGANMGLVNATQ